MKRTIYILTILICSQVYGETSPIEDVFLYELVMSKDDNVCRPLLTVFNRNVSADLIDLRRIDDPVRYSQRPQPMPTSIGVPWKTIYNKGGRTIATLSKDIDGDGDIEMVERRVDRLRRDGLAVSLWFMSKNYVPLPVEYSQEAYQAARREALMVIEEEDVVFSVKPYSATTLNAFDLINFRGKYYLTARAHVLDDDLYFERSASQWRVVTTIEVNSAGPPTEGVQKARKLITATEDICHFLMKSK